MRFQERWRRLSALLLSGTLLASGCATRGGGRLDRARPPGDGHAAIVEFVQKLPIGTPVQIDRIHGRAVRGTLLKVSAEAVTVQPRTRLPEPPVEIRMADIVRVQPAAANDRSIGKAVGIGVAAGGATALAVFLLLLAILSH